MLIDINIPKKIGQPEIYNINRNLYIQIQNFKKRNVEYSDVFLIDKKHKNEIFIGRFIEPISKVKASYNDGKILIYHDEYNSELRCDVVTCVLLLYNMVDDINYSCSEEEALIIFDNNAITDYLENKNSSIVKIDLKRKKLRR